MSRAEAQRSQRILGVGLRSLGLARSAVRVLVFCFYAEDVGEIGLEGPGSGLGKTGFFFGDNKVFTCLVSRNDVGGIIAVSADGSGALLKMFDRLLDKIYPCAHGAKVYICRSPEKRP